MRILVVEVMAGVQGERRTPRWRRRDGVIYRTSPLLDCETGIRARTLLLLFGPDLCEELDMCAV